MGRLGILAGGGTLPARLAAVAGTPGAPVFVVAFTGHTDPCWVEQYPHMWSRLGAAGAVLERLRHEGVTELVFAGPVRRPTVSELRPDWRAAMFFARVGTRILGDDSLLRAVAAGLEEEGFQVRAVQDVLSGLLTPPGVLGAHHPDAVAERDIAHGLRVAQALGRLDVGQAVVVQQGLVLGVEAIEGTDALIARCGRLRRAGEGGVLVKVRKPQQDNRLDLPALGVATVEAAAAAGLRGIAAEAGGSLMLEREAMRVAADRLGLFVQGVVPDQDFVRIDPERLAERPAE